MFKQYFNYFNYLLNQTRAPDVKLTRRILEKYGYQNRKISEKEFIKVVKDLCGFSTKKLEIVTAEEVFTKQRKNH